MGGGKGIKKAERNGREPDGEAGRGGREPGATCINMCELSPSGTSHKNLIKKYTWEASKTNI